MPRLHIPRIGEHLTLAEDWQFTLHGEHRNESLIKATGVNADTVRALSAYSYVYNKSWDDVHENAEAKGWQFVSQHHAGGQAVRLMTIPEGATLSLERIYIRRGQEDFDSVSFSLIRDSVKGTDFGDTLPPKGRVRFWAKLDDVNTIVLARKGS